MFFFANSEGVLRRKNAKNGCFFQTRPPFLHGKYGMKMPHVVAEQAFDLFDIYILCAVFVLYLCGIRTVFVQYSYGQYMELIRMLALMMAIALTRTKAISRAAWY